MVVWVRRWRARAGGAAVRRSACGRLRFLMKTEGVCRWRSVLAALALVLRCRTRRRNPQQLGLRARILHRHACPPTCTRGKAWRLYPFRLLVFNTVGTLFQTKFLFLLAWKATHLEWNSNLMGYRVTVVYDTYCTVYIVYTIQCMAYTHIKILVSHYVRGLRVFPLISDAHADVSFLSCSDANPYLICS